MLKTVKVKKQMHLDELIKYIFDNGIEDKTYGVIDAFNNTSEVRISGSGNIKMSGYINQHTTFTVEMEEEITEDTELFGVQEVCMDKEKEEIGVEYWPDGCSVNDVLNDYNCSIECLQIYAKVNGKLQLIWEVE